MSSSEVRRSLLLPLLSNDENSPMSSFKAFLKASAPDRNQCIFYSAGILVPPLYYTHSFLSYPLILVRNRVVVLDLWNDNQNQGWFVRRGRNGIHSGHFQFHPISRVPFYIPNINIRLSVWTDRRTILPSSDDDASPDPFDSQSSSRATKLLVFGIFCIALGSIAVAVLLAVARYTAETDGKAWITMGTGLVLQSSMTCLR